MKTINEYFDELKDKCGSDYAAAKNLGINKVTISSGRRRGQISDETAIKMADLLGVDRGELLLAAAMARSEGETKGAWSALAKRLSVAAGWVLVAGLSLNGGDFYRVQTVDNIHYANLLLAITIP
ncbi:hypothetical protein [Methylomonas fluvii]|uniref:HTH cro/C1-type domain-containing protein n=1 Tax=Methylomonas fluvii TaxID=1854564 RepID=A0ABR9DKG0_9GAMM|nr:hypothetical protein [Methylomonas fluvii]MBD9362709.1 hypothetical protein [Methylomonas fluvii]